MGDGSTGFAVPPSFADRSKVGLVLGALVGALLFRPVGGAVALVGWIIGGVVGAEVLQAEDGGQVRLLYALETLSFSLLVILSEYALLTVLTDWGRIEIEAVIAVAGLVTLGVFLSCDDVVTNGYNLLIVFGVVGLVTLALVPPIVSGGGYGNGTPTPTETPTATPSPTPTRTSEPAYEPNWTFAIQFVDNTTYEYYAARWTYEWVGNVAAYDTRQAAYDDRSTLRAADVSRLTVEQQPNGTWEIRRDFGENRSIASRWQFVPRIVSDTGTASGIFADDLHIYDQRDIASVEIREPLGTHRLPSIAEQGIQNADDRQSATPRRSEPARDDSTSAPTQRRVQVPWWLYVVYGSLFVFGGLLRAFEHDLSPTTRSR
ncbi:hypothetical protein ACFR9U_10300 [Halorientalis brevis]|uniref:Uncharacterized protein n=1 Tax=Halorientalis brevis TaxID=1126241 RepID=A0ABD6CBR4_9EURY|nr:hypothetical protein [Halorientalis brevis]